MLGLFAGCEGPPLRIDELIVTSTRDGRLLQIDVPSGEVRSIELGLPLGECGAAADVPARDLYTSRRNHQDSEYTLFRIDVDAGRIVRKQSWDEVARAAGVDMLQSLLDCPMALAGGRLYTALARISGGRYVVVALDPRELAPVRILEPIAVIPRALVVTGPLSDAPEGALLVQGPPADTFGQPIRGAVRIVGFDLATGARLPRLDLDFDAPNGYTAAVADSVGKRLYAAVYPWILVVNLEPPGDTAMMPAASPGPLALGEGHLFQGSSGGSVQVPGSGQVYYYDLVGVLRDSVDVQPPSLTAPPFIREVARDSRTEHLFLHVGTGEGGLFYDLQRGRVLVVDVASRRFLGEIPLGVWSGGRMLVYF